jgi:hypothetical protein
MASVAGATASYRFKVMLANSSSKYRKSKQTDRSRGFLSMKKIMMVLEFVFGCWHRNLSRPFTLSGWTYEVCLSCGRKFAYDRAEITLGQELKRFEIQHSVDFDSCLTPDGTTTCTARTHHTQNAEIFICRRLEQRMPLARQGDTRLQSVRIGVDMGEHAEIMT